MLKARLAFVLLSFVTAFTILHCSSSDSRPPLTQETDDGSTTAPPVTHKDSGTLRDANEEGAVDAGPPAPNLVISTNSVDFAQVPCGTQATMKLVTLTNTGNVPLTIAFNMLNGGTAFDVDMVVLGADAGTPAKSIVLPAGQQASLRVTPAKVPAVSPTTADYYSDTISLNTSPALPAGQGAANLNIVVKETAKGAILRFAPTAIDFGSVPLNSTPNSSFSVVNDGNAAAEVDLTIASGGASTSIIGRTPLGPVTINGAATLNLQASFQANDTSPQTATMTMTATSNPGNSFCQPLPQPMTLRGTGTTGTAGVSPGSISFGNAGLVDCGTQGAPKTITITNSGNGPFAWTASLISGSSFYTVSPQSGTVPAQIGQTPGSQTIQVTPITIPFPSSIQPELYSGTVRIHTITSDPDHDVQLHMTAHGAILTSTLGGQTLAFGNQAVGQTSTAQFSVSNNGNAPADISFNNGSAVFAITSPTTVGATQSVAPTVSFTPANAQPYTDTGIINISAGTVLCAPKPANMTMTGNGVPVAPPVMTTSQAAVDFGQVACAAAGQPQSFAIINGGSNPITVTATFRNGGNSLFTFSGPATVPAGGQRNATVSMATIPFPGSVTPDFYADVLTVTGSTAGGTVSRDIAVHVTGKGAIMRFSPTSLDYGTVPVNSTQTLPFKVVNDGNLAAEINLTMSNGAGSASLFSRSPLGTVTTAASSTQPMTSSFAANDTIAQQGSLTMTATSNPANVFCAVMPSPLQLTGQGTSVTASVTPASLSFGPTNCGSQAAPQQVTVSNLAQTGTINFSATLTSGASFYTVGPPSGAINGGQSVNVQVTPNPIPQTSPVAQDAFAGTLTITTTAPNDTPHVIQLHQTAQGVILVSTAGSAINFGGVAVNQTATSQFSMTNNGNVAINGIQFKNSNAIFSVNPAPSPTPNAQELDFSLAPNASVSPTITFRPTTVQQYTDTATFTLPPGTVLCTNAPPPNIALSGSGTTGVGVSPTNLNFGIVQCKSTPPQGQAITINNQGVACSYTATFGRGAQNLPSYYTLADAPTGGNTITTGSPHPLAGGGSITVYVVPNPITTPASTAADAFFDTLTITTNCTGDQPHNVALHETAQGAFLAVTPIKIQFGGVTPGHVSFENFSVTNTGNLAATYALQVTIQAGSGGPNPGLCQTYNASNFPSFCINFGGGSIFGGQTQNGVVEAEGAGLPDGGPAESLGYITLTPDPSAVLCSDPVPVIPLSAN
jgi:hypothetical protein